MYSAHKPTNNKGYTLIELLVVVLVIGVLAGLMVGIINSQGFFSKSRDTQRISDLKRIQTALELFYADYRCYPNSRPTGGSVCTGEGNWMLSGPINGSDTLTGVLAPDYINVMPVDPIFDPITGNRGPCGGVEDRKRYNYVTSADGASYIITAIMEIESSNEDHMCTSLNNWEDFPQVGNWCTTSDPSPDVYCYGVENP